MTERTTTQVYEHLRRSAPAFAETVEKAVRSAHNEAEFERLVNNAVAEVAGELGVQLLFRMSTMQVFEGASTRTSVFVMQKDQPTRYPVPYTYWQKTVKGRGLDYDSSSRK